MVLSWYSNGTEKLGSIYCKLKTTCLKYEHAEMATHSSALAWRIPGTGASWAAVYEVAQSRTTEAT